MTRIERFRDAYWTWFLQPKSKGGLAGRRVLTSLFPHAWRRGTPSDQCLVLDFLARTAEPRGEAIVHEGLRDRRSSIRGNALVAALFWARKEALGRPLVAQLKRIASRSANETQRSQALEALIEARAVDAAWLTRVAREDTSAEVRQQAYAQLLPAGSKEAKRALLSDVRRHPDSFGVAQEIWQHRSAVGLTEREESFLRGVIGRYVEWLEHRLGDADGNQATRTMARDMLTRFAGDGFAVHPHDGRAVRTAAPRASA
jgi:hypothetical protein